MTPFECLFYIFVVLDSKLRSKIGHRINYFNTIYYFLEKD
jgi:hypothetical protein